MKLRPRYELRRMDPRAGTTAPRGPTFWSRRRAARAAERVTELALWPGAMVLDLRRDAAPCGYFLSPHTEREFLRDEWRVSPTE